MIRPLSYSLNRFFFIVLCLITSSTAWSDSTGKMNVLNAKVEATLEQLFALHPEVRETVESANGVLVFPEIVKGGFWVGGEYGKGALLRDMAVIDYYHNTSGSIGVQFGVQVRSQVILFNNEASYKNFRSSGGWEAGVDGSVAVATIGAGGRLDTKSINQPVSAIIFGNKGLMVGASIEGTKFSRIETP